MTNKTKVRLMLGAVFVLFLVASVCAIRFGGVYGETLKFRVNTDQTFDFSWFRFWGAAIAIFAAILTLDREFRGMGWLFGGFLLACWIIITGLLVKINGSSFNYETETYSAIAPLVVAGVMGVATTVLAALLCRHDELEHLHNHFNAVELSEQLKNSAKASEEALTEANERVATANEYSKNLRTALSAEQDLHRETKKYRPFESQLVAGLTISLGAAWRDRHSKNDLRLDQFTGNQDRTFADFVGQTEGWCWLNELKRDRACVASEFKKKAKLEQFAAIKERRDMIAIAARCHWLGWGETNGKEVKLRFVDYWKIWFRPENALEAGAIDNHAFAERAFAELPEHAVGVRPDEFAQYVRFLASYGGDATNEDTVAALVFHRDKTGRIRYWIEPSILSITQTITDRYQKLAQEREARQITPKNFPRPDNSEGMHFGR